MNRTDSVEKQLTNLVRQYAKEQITRETVELRARNLYGVLYAKESSVELALKQFMKTVR